MSENHGSFQITAEVAAIPPVETREAKGKTYTDRLIVLIIAPGKYEQRVAFEVRDKQADDLAALRVGDTVTVNFNLRGREWTDPKTGKVKYFGSNQVWKIELAAGKPRGATPATEPGPDDDIPFLTCELGAEPSPIWRPFR